MSADFWWGVLGGWTAGVVFVGLAFWRRLSAWHVRENQRLRGALQDAQAQLDALREIDRRPTAPSTRPSAWWPRGA